MSNWCDLAVAIDVWWKIYGQITKDPVISSVAPSKEKCEKVLLPPPRSPKNNGLHRALW